VQQLSLEAAACWAEAHFLFPPGGLCIFMHTYPTQT
jgi:hypothetical protein